MQRYDIPHIIVWHILPFAIPIVGMAAAIAAAARGLYAPRSFWPLYALFAVPLIFNSLFLIELRRRRFLAIAAETERGFAARGFFFDRRIEALNCVIYIERGRRVGFIWETSPRELAVVDPREIESASAHDGRLLWATRHVYCAFVLYGRRHNILTFHTYRRHGRLVSSTRVREAVRDAEIIADALTGAKAGMRQSVPAHKF